MRYATRIRALALAACAVLAMAAAASAQGRATLNGVVVGPTGMPQANVTLVVTNAQGIDRRAVSDMNGAFVFGGLQPGTYRLRTDDETFAPYSQDQIMLAGGQTQQIRIALQPRVPVDAAPTQRGRIAGTIIGPDGRPRGNVTIIITNPAGVDRRAVTEANGAYVFGGLQAGTYRIRIEDAGADAQPFNQTNLALAAGEQRQLDVRLQQIPIVAPPPPPLVPGRGGPVPAEPKAEKPKKERNRPEEIAVPEVTGTGGDFQAFPDRWAYKFPEYQRYSPPQKMPWIVGSPLDPYNQNPAKGDFPVLGSDSLFANLNMQLNSNVNPRQVGAGTPTSQLFFNNNFVGSLELFRGETVFQPKSWSVRGTVVGNVNALNVSGAASQNEHTYGVEEAFAEKRLAVLSPSFDFVSVRAGMQNFNSDFRGYLFVDNQLGVRVFGNAGANRSQYNVAFFSMRDRDVVSQLHSFGNRNQNVVIANYFVQDFGVKGYTALFNVHVNQDSKTSNAPGNIQTGSLNVTYIGFHGDGKWGPWAVSHAFYEAVGKDDDNAIARKLSGAAAPVDINAQMAAIEISRDADWLRYRGSLFYASGDNRSDPTKAKGFDSITDNPNIAGGQFMFFTQQKTAVGGLPLDGGVLSEKFSIYPSLRSKFTDRSNFVNPGLVLVNGGLDFRVSPQLKVVTNVSYLRFADATVLQQLVKQAGKPGFEDSSIGLDVGAGAKFRPFVNENMFVVLGFSTLAPRGGLATALGSDSKLYSFVGAIQLAY